MFNSFRLRLAIWSAVLAGVALAGFMAIAWWQMRASKIATLDREILEQTARELSHPWPLEHWQHHAQLLGRSFGAENQQQSLLVMQDNRGNVYQSEHWPEDLDITTLAWPINKSPQSVQQALFAPPPIPDYHRPLPLPGLPDYRPPFPPENAAPPPVNALPRPPAFKAVTLAANNGDWRFGLATNEYGDKLAIGVNLSVIDNDMQELQNAFLLATPLALAFIGFGAWLLSARALTPIRQLSKTMEQLTAKGLDQRLAVAQQDQEFRQLILVFNSMLERLERSFLQASRFSADAAHELKTPLAILQGQIERAISQCAAGSPIQSHLSNILDEVQRLSTITRKLLLLSLADAGRLRLHLKPFDISKALTELVEDSQMLAPSLNVTATIASGLTSIADDELIWQVLHNLLSNAIKYNIPGGWLHIAASRRPGIVEIVMVNSSLGIAEADQERIFERFYRVEQSHNRQIDGLGLGLSLSREIVRAHHGELLLDNSLPGQSKFVLSLPSHHVLDELEIS